MIRFFVLGSSQKLDTSTHSIKAFRLVMPLDGQHLPELPLLRFRRKGGNFFRLPEDHDLHLFTPPLRPREGRLVASLCVAFRLRFLIYCLWR